jgi:hypothetical protein
LTTLWLDGLDLEIGVLQYSSEKKNQDREAQIFLCTNDLFVLDL